MRQPAPTPAIALLALAAMLGGSSANAADGPSCAASIAVVMEGIAARDLDTTRGPPLNAFLALNPYAVAEAEALDRAAAAGRPRGPLHCMPVAVKDNFATYDMPMTVGSLSLVGNQPPRDAAIVARLRQAGAVIVGKTNMDEFAFGIDGLSGAGGRVGNAYDPARTSGGSSAGSGVAVGAGFVPLAVGSDNCGSLRIPAVYNGAVALRPTYGRFDAEGLFPMGFVNGTPGLIARDIPTLALGLSVVDPGWRKADAGVKEGLAGRRLGVLVRAGADSFLPKTPDAERLLASALDLARARGAEIVPGVTLGGFDPNLGPAFVAGSGPRIDAMLSAYPAARRNWAEVCHSGRIPPEWTPDECEALVAVPPPEEDIAPTEIAQNRAEIVAVMDRLDLDGLVYLTDLRGGAGTGETDGYTCFVASISGLPAIAIPGGLDGAGMPVGVEILGRPGSDEALVAMAAALETARGPLSPAPEPVASPALAELGLAEQNTIRLYLGWKAFLSRDGEALGDLQPDRFRALVQRTLPSWPDAP